MQFLTTSELRRPDAWDAVHRGKAVVTSHGKPIVLMIPVTGEDFEDTLELVNQVEAMRALTRLQSQAHRSGGSEMSLDDINAEIGKARKERAGRKGRKGRPRATRRP